jgi:hypothetical protein
MKNTFILLIAFALFVLSTGCVKEDTQLAESHETPTITITEIDESDVTNPDVTMRANCNCVLRSTSQLIAKADICGATLGTSTCVNCSSLTATFLQSLNLANSAGFAVPMGGAIRVTNTTGTTVQFNLDCGGAPLGGVTFTLAPGASQDFITNNGCDLSNC